MKSTKSTPLLIGLAVFLLIAAAVDYFLLVPRGTFGPLSLWMLTTLAIIAGMLSLVLFLIAVTLTARARHRDRNAKTKAETRGSV
jgi:hypothetical protein